MKIRDLYDLWYSNSVVINNMVYYMRYREGGAIGPRIQVRNMRIRNPYHFEENKKRFGFDEYLVNYYYSLAVMKKEMPLFNFDLEKRRVESQVFDELFAQYMDGYDFAIDIDSKELGMDQATQDMQTIHRYFLKKEVPHQVRFSGSGFHIVVYSNCLFSRGLKFDPLIAPTMCQYLSLWLKEKLGCPTIDNSIYDQRRIFKLPYSLDIKTGNVCLPMREEEINLFDINEFHSDSIMESVQNLYNRGIFKGDIHATREWVMGVFRPRASTPGLILDVLKDWGGKLYG